MKITLANLLRNLSQYRAVLIYGNDYGVVFLSAEQIIDSLIQERSIFNFLQFEYDEINKTPAILGDHVNSLSFTGEIKVILINNCDKALPAWHKELLQNLHEQIFIIYRAQELAPTNSLRKFFEQDKSLAILPCYHDEKEVVAGLLRNKLREHSITITSDALAYLLERLGGDRLATLAEIEKIVTYAQGSDQITLSDVEEIVSDSSLFVIDDFCYKLLSLDLSEYQQYIQHFMESKISIITLIRALLKLIHQLLRVRVMFEQNGSSLAESIAKLTPPIFYRSVAIFTKCAEQNDTKTLLHYIDQLARLELLCKTSNTDHLPLFDAVIMQLFTAR